MALPSHHAVPWRTVGELRHEGAGGGSTGSGHSAAGYRWQDLGEPVRDEDGTYIGTYSNFWSDFSQIRGLVLFSLFLGSFFIGGQVVAGLLVGHATLVCLASPLHQLD